MKAIVAMITGTTIYAMGIAVGYWLRGASRRR